MKGAWGKSKTALLYFQNCDPSGWRRSRAGMTVQAASDPLDGAGGDRLGEWRRRRRPRGMVQVMSDPLDGADAAGCREGAGRTGKKEPTGSIGRVPMGQVTVGRLGSCQGAHHRRTALRAWGGKGRRCVPWSSPGGAVRRGRCRAATGARGAGSVRQGRPLRRNRTTRNGGGPFLINGDGPGNKPPRGPRPRAPSDRRISRYG